MVCGLDGNHAPVFRRDAEKYPRDAGCYSIVSRGGHPRRDRDERDEREKCQILCAFESLR